MKINNKIKIIIISLIILIILNTKCEKKIDLSSDKFKYENFRDRERALNARAERAVLTARKLHKRLLTSEEEKKALERANSALEGQIKELSLVKQTVKIVKTVPTIIYLPAKKDSLSSHIVNEEKLPPFIDPPQKEQQLPTYSSSFSDKYHSISIISSPDSTSYDLSVTNDFEISSSKKSSFLGLGKTRYFVNVRSNNPYTDSLSVKTYSIIDKPKRLGFGLIGGYGLTNKGLSPIVGLGFQFKIF